MGITSDKEFRIFGSYYLNTGSVAPYGLDLTESG